MPHNRQIQQFIQACPREDWVMFCYDRPDFLPLYNELKADTNLTKALADYLKENPDLVEPLLAWGQKRHPQLYTRYIGKGESAMSKMTTQKAISLVIIITMLSGVICELWMVINPPGPSCSVTVQDFAFNPKVIRVNESVDVTVNINNPQGLGVKYNWSVTDGKVNPALNAIEPTTIYTAPNYAGNQTITVKVLPVGCEAIEHSEQIVIGAASSEAPPPAETLPFEAAKTDEKLIVVMKFDDRSEGVFNGVDPSSQIYNMILKSAGDTQVRVERYPTAVQDAPTAKRIGKQANATLVIWGYYDSLKIQPYIELVKEQQTQLVKGIPDINTATPVTYYFVKTAPEQSAYLGLYTLGLTFIAFDSAEKLHQAITFFDAALNITEGWEAYMWRANCYSLLKEYPTAIKDYNYALELKPDDVEGYSNRATTYVAMQQYDKAIMDYTQAITLKPDFPTIYYNRGSTYSDMQQYDKAIIDYTQAITLKPDFTGAYNNRATVYAIMQQYNKAIIDFTQLITMEPNNASSYYNLGSAYAAIQNYDKAIDNFTQAITLKHGFAEAYVNRGNSYNDIQQYDKAIMDFTQAITLKPDFTMAYYNRGITYNDIQQYDKAIMDYTQAITLKPDFTMAYVNRGAIYGNAQQYDKAIHDFTKAVELDPNFTLAYANRGTVYKILWQQGQPTREKAIADFEQVLKLLGDSNPEWRKATENDLRELRE